MDNPRRQAKLSPDSFNLTPAQKEAARLPLEGSLFLSGPAMCGKTTAAVRRLETALRAGLGETTLVLAPQRTLARPYQELIRSSDLPPGGCADVLTLGGLARRALDLFWPIFAGPAGFDDPGSPPVFLTMESAQYYLARFVDPRLQEGRFDAVSIDRGRLLSQILDNLNKSAVMDFPHTEIARKLNSAWTGKDGQRQVYEQAQECAALFRAFCYEHNLLDFSLQIKVFREHLWPAAVFQRYLEKKYRHLIYDNIEEDFPVAHDLVREWLPRLDSALLVYDSGGGFRSFLGADPASAAGLADSCGKRAEFSFSFVEPAALSVFRESLTTAIRREKPETRPSVSHPAAASISQQKYVPEMVEAVGEEVRRLYSASDPPPSICVIAPFLSDSLSFSLGACLDRLGVPHRAHRPSQPLSGDPAVRCLLVLARLGHPAWGQPVSVYELRSALIQALAGLDLNRADLLARAVLPAPGSTELKSFLQVPAVEHERITSTVGRAYETLREWLANYRGSPSEELDVFMSRLFGELLSQPGFGFHKNFEGASAAAELIESIKKFRAGRVITEENPGIPAGLDYIRMLQSGIIAAQYLSTWQPASPSEVYIAPAYTFLMNNQAVDFQVWLDLGSRGWWERLYQPLTHPVVLSRAWGDEKPWTDADEVEMNHSLLTRLVGGLTRRCRKGVFLHALSVNEQGDEQRGALLQAVQAVIRRNPGIIEVADV